MNATAIPVRRNSPRAKLKRAAPWAAAESIFSAGSTLLATLVVARVLDPSQFGLVAVALATSALVQVVCFAGIPQALVRTRHVGPDLSDQVFWILLGLGVAGSAFCWAVAWPLARFYGQPVLFWLIGVAGFEVLLNALIQFPTALLTRKMRTRSLALRMLGQKTVGMVATVGIAFAGGGPWSLVAGTLAGATASALLLWRTQPRVPRLRRFDARIRPILSMGSLIVVEASLNAVTVRGLLLAFGKFHGLHDLGLLNFAMRLVEEMGTLLDNTLRRLSLAFFVSLERAGGDLRQAFLVGSHGIALVGAPVFLGLAAVADDAVPLIFGEHWRPAVPAVQLFAVFWGLRMSRTLSVPLMQTLGKQGPLVFNAALASLATGIMVFATRDAMLTIAALSFVTRLLVTLPAGVFTLKRVAGVSVRAQVGAVLPAFAIAGVMALLVVVGRDLLLPVTSALPRIALLVFWGALVYGGLVLLVDRRQVRRLVTMLRPR